jgi:hypothetical protein
LENRKVREAVRAVRKHNDAIPEAREQAIKSVDCSLSVTKRGILFFDLFDLGFFHDVEPLPITDEKLTKPSRKW